MRTINDKREKEQGATALIVVIFSILLLVTISLGFLRLVVRDQQRTIDDELSRGAYDAALAGVEDGKRVLQKCIVNGDSDSACLAITANKCNSVHAAQILSSTDTAANDAEVLIKSGSVGNAQLRAETYDQAYTCVKVQRDTDAYERELLADTSQVIPLNTLASFTDIDVSWYKPPSLSSLYLGVDPNSPLPALSDWAPAGSVRPPILRVQLIQYNDGNFDLGDFDAIGGGNTLYLYPSDIGLVNYDFVNDGRRTGSDATLKNVNCDPAASPYVCKATLKLPDPLGGSSASRKAYLRVTAIYGDTDFRVSAVGTKLHDVQPAVDSTGRASDVFRRVKANVELVSPFDIYPRATVDITGNFCKDFSVSATAFMAGGCTP